jgi:hypothetical protein
MLVAARTYKAEKSTRDYESESQSKMDEYHWDVINHRYSVAYFTVLTPPLGFDPAARRVRLLPFVKQKGLGSYQ